MSHNSIIQYMSSYSTNHISEQLLDEIKKALETISFGSVEIYVQDNVVTQISIRNIKKTLAHSNSLTTDRNQLKNDKGNN